MARDGGVRISMLEQLGGVGHTDFNAATMGSTADLSEATYDADQARELARLDLNFLAALAMPTIFEFDFPPVLLAAWSLLTQQVISIRTFVQIALGIPRGHGKTTLVKLFILYCILFTTKRFILVTSSTASLAENIVADVFDMLSERNIRTLFGNWDIGVETNRNDMKKFSFRQRSIIVAAVGAQGSVRGLNVKNARPDVMVFDDIQTKECAESQMQAETLERWMIGTAMKAKDPRGCLFIFAGNIFPTPYSILKKLKTNPTWIKFISGAILADGTALWPELRSFDSLIEELNTDIAAGHPEIFFSEVLNDTDSGINTKVDFAKIRSWPYNNGELPQGKFIVIDPSANKKGGDDVAIGYFEVFDSIPCCIEVIEEPLSPGNTIRRALLMAISHRCKVVAVEGTAYQATLCYWAEETMKSLQILGIHFVEVHPGNASKNARITEMTKGLTSGELLVHTSVRSQVLHQISNWNPLKRDNVDGILDLLTYAPKVVELFGHLVVTDEEEAVRDQGDSGLVEGAFAF